VEKADLAMLDRFRPMFRVFIAERVAKVDTGEVLMDDDIVKAFLQCQPEAIDFDGLHHSVKLPLVGVVDYEMEKRRATWSSKNCDQRLYNGYSLTPP
jgi:hypothetical protein